MTVNQFIKELESLKSELRKKQVVIIAPNGLEFDPMIKQQLIDYTKLFSGEIKNIKNIKNMVITYE